MPEKHSRDEWYQQQRGMDEHGLVDLSGHRRQANSQDADLQKHHLQQRDHLTLRPALRIDVGDRWWAADVEGGAKQAREPPERERGPRRKRAIRPLGKHQFAKRKRDDQGPQQANHELFVQRLDQINTQWTAERRAGNELPAAPPLIVGATTQERHDVQHETEHGNQERRVSK